MSSTDERKIPKIVLKINRNDSSATNHELDQASGGNNSIFSAKAAEIAIEIYKTDKNKMIPFILLLKHANQDAYKSIENVLELMGRMNDIEKKKTLYQVLFKIREVYYKLLLILEWKRVSNEHLALNLIKTTAFNAKDGLNKLIEGLFHNSNLILTRTHYEPNFKALKSLFSSTSQVPSYFPNSINALSPKKPEDLSERDENCWMASLDTLLRFEISKNIISVSKQNCRLISIAEGKAKVLFLNLFEFEFTIVPVVEENILTPAWFILSVSVGKMKELFKNSLTGIFQFKHNNKITSNTEYFKTIQEDCQKYINIFYYEKIFSQFHFLSNSCGKSICLFQKGPQGDWFKISPWFLAKEPVDIRLSITPDMNLIISEDLKLLCLIPSISFDENESSLIYENLFINFYMKKLESFFTEIQDRNIFISYNLSGKFCYEIVIFEESKIRLTINPFTKRFKFDLVSPFSLAISSDYLEEHLMNFDGDKFLEKISEIKKELLTFMISSYHDDSNENNCTLTNSNLSEISSKTSLCFKSKKTNSCFSIDLYTNQINFWKLLMNFNNGFLDIKLEDFGMTRGVLIPPSREELFTLLRVEGSFLCGLSSKNSFENIVKSCRGIEGEFLDENTFKVYSFGLPNCVKSVLLIGIDDEICGRIEFSELVEVKSQNVEIVLKNLKNLLILFTIWEESNLLGSKFEIISLKPVTIRSEGTGKVIKNSEEGKLVISDDGGEDGYEELVKFIESESFSIYEFLDLIQNKFDGKMNEKEKSPDLTWFSDSFM